MWMHRLFAVKTVADLERALYCIEAGPAMFTSVGLLLILLGSVFSPHPVGVVWLLGGIIFSLTGVYHLRRSYVQRRWILGMKPTDAELLTIHELMERGDTSVEHTVTVTRKKQTVKTVVITRPSGTEYEN